MLQAQDTTGSLRFWVGSGIALAILPLLLSAVIGYFILDRSVVAVFEDVAARQRNQLDPNQDLRIALWEAAVPIELYLDDGNSAHLAEYRVQRDRIETAFAQLHRALETEPEAKILVEQARQDWARADRIADDVASGPATPGGRGALSLEKQFDAIIASVVDKLQAASRDISLEVEQDRVTSARAYERSKWVAGIAAAVSLLTMAGGVLIIGRFLLASVDRLVDGAARFAAGDRDHRIEIQVPPELRKVAEEFNRMIVRIRDNEASLAEQARRDRLTNLLNRRAFDEALADAFARKRRLHEPLGLMMLDLDHFKRINDGHGHAAGDAVLRWAASTVVSSLREVDKVFRIGGEEFAVLLLGTDRAGAETTAERVRTSVAKQPVDVDGTKLSVTLSIGVALASDEIDADGLMRAADAALYRAKNEGRNRVGFADRPIAQPPMS